MKNEAIARIQPRDNLKLKLVCSSIPRRTKQEIEIDSYFSGVENFRMNNDGSGRDHYTDLFLVHAFIRVYFLFWFSQKFNITTVLHHYFDYNVTVPSYILCIILKSTNLCLLSFQNCAQWNRVFERDLKEQ